MTKTKEQIQKYLQRLADKRRLSEFCRQSKLSHNTAKKLAQGFYANALDGTLKSFSTAMKKFK